MTYVIIKYHNLLFIIYFYNYKIIILVMYKTYLIKKTRNYFIYQIHFIISFYLHINGIILFYLFVLYNTLYNIIILSS